MALINLPAVGEVTPQWDTTKLLHEQSKLAQSYVSGVLSSVSATTNSQEECGAPNSGVFRWIEKTYADTPHHLKVVVVRQYINSTTNHASFAVNNNNFTIEQI